MEQVESRILLSLVTVNSTGDTNVRDMVLTLREAMLYTNGSMSYASFDATEQAQIDESQSLLRDTIAFNIAGGGSAATITVGNQLPTISSSVLIDGTTQLGPAETNPGITLDGNSSVATGLEVSTAGGGSEIRGLSVGGFLDRGIYLNNSTGNIIAGNHIGTDITGTIAFPNGNGDSVTDTGIRVNGGTGNTIGGITAADRNIVSGNNPTGIFLTQSAQNVRIVGNYVGLDVTGLNAIPNQGEGFRLDASPTNNTVGGSTPAERNIISGNGTDGLVIRGDDNIVTGNYIGVDVTGTVAVPNGTNGIHIFERTADNNTIGGTNTVPGVLDFGNLISGNNGDGIQLVGTANFIRGNFIGTDPTGTFAIPNSVGISVEDDPDDSIPAGTLNVIGGTNSGVGLLSIGNLISGNTNSGILFNADTGANTVQGNYIGTDISGTLALANGQDGVEILTGSEDNTIGGINGTAGSLLTGNLISGNTRFGVNIDGTGNEVLGNFIGMNPQGTAPLPNGSNPVNVTGSFNIIGGTNTAVGELTSGNLISGQTVAGIVLSDSTENRILGNFLGTDATGTLDLGNTGPAVSISPNSSDNTIGGESGASGNRIAFNGTGVVIDTSTGNSIYSNSFFANDNAISFINGANNGQVSPTLIEAVLLDADTIRILGSLNGAAPGESYALQLFASDASLADAEAEIYLGTTTITTDGTGNVTFSEAVDFSAAAINVGMAITAIVTRDSTGDSSNISAATELLPLSLVVTNTNDSGPGSLRQIISDSNLASGTQTISFDIAGPGPHTIQLLSALPEITDTIVIDGTTEPDFTTTPVIVLDGSSAGAMADGLVLGGASDGSTIRGLVIQGFDDDGLEINSSGNLIAGNFVGLDASGTMAVGNQGNGLSVGASNNTIGGSTPAEANFFSGNAENGVVLSGFGNVLRGNGIGVGADGTAVGNGEDGILVGDASGNTIGGDLETQGNVIAFNAGNGITIVGNSDLIAILGNQISGNGGLGIDLGDDGVTENDYQDPDDDGNTQGPNRLQNYPVLTSVVTDVINGTTFQGTFNSLPDSTFRLEFFGSAVADPSGFGQGATFLFSLDVTTDANGDAVINTTMAALNLTPGSFVSATATLVDDGYLDTSEFSNARVVAEPADLAIALSDLPDPVLVGAQLTYTITVSNNGPGSAASVVVTDLLPAGVTFVSASSSQGSVVHAGGTVTAEVGTLGNGETATITVVVTPLPSAVGTITNTVNVTTTSVDGESGNDQASVDTTVSPVIDLSVTGTGSPDPIPVGGTLTYTLTVTNGGPNAATGVTLTNALPAGVTFVSASSSQGSAAIVGGVITASLGDLAASGTATVTIVVTPGASNAGILSNTFSVSGIEAEGDPDTNQVVIETTVTPVVDLAVSGSASPDPAFVGRTLTYTLTVTNGGPNAATGVTLTNALPAGVTFVSASSSQGSAAIVGGVITASLGDLAASGTATVTIVVRPGESNIGTLGNTFSVTADEGDDESADDSVTIMVVVEPAPQGVIPADYNGDRFSDLALYSIDPETDSGRFDIRLESGEELFYSLGQPGDIAVDGDFDGDLISDPAVFRPNVDTNGDGVPDAAGWYILQSSNGQIREVLFGAPGLADVPIPADYDGDGITDIATFRSDSDLTPGAADWFILPSSGGSAYQVTFGAANIDQPVPGDYDGDGKADIATFRSDSDLTPGAADWFILPSSGGSAYQVTFGAANIDQPVPGDYDGDGKADIATFRSDSDLTPGMSEWFLLLSEGPAQSIPLGSAGDLAAPGDYFGDGRLDLATFDLALDTWRIRSLDGTLEEEIAFGRETLDEVPITSPLADRLRRLTSQA